MVHNVRDKHHIAAGHKERNVDDAPHGLHLNVVIKRLGILLIEVADHRILLVLREILRLVQQAVQPGAVKGRPVIELHRTPVVLGDLRIDGAQLLLVLADDRGYIHIHRIPEVALLIEEGRCFSGLEKAAPGIATLDQRLELLHGLCQGEGSHAVFLGHVVKHVHVNVFTNPKVTLIILRAVFYVDNAVGRVLFAASSEAHGLSVRRHFPDVVLVIEQYGAVFLHPAGHAAGLRLHGVVVVFLHECTGDRHYRIVFGIANVPAKVLVAPPDGISAQRRQCLVVCMALRHFVAIDADGLTHLVVPLRLHRVVNGHNHIHWSVTLVTDREAVPLTQRERNQSPVHELRGIRAAGIPGKVHFLGRRKLVGIPVPDIEARRLKGNECSVLRGNVCLHTHEDALAVMAEGRFGILRQAPSGGKLRKRSLQYLGR